MRDFFSVLILGGLASGPAFAATITATTSIDPGTTPQVVITSDYSEAEQNGLPGPNDTGFDRARASADLVTGQMRFRALDGRQTSDQSIYQIQTQTGASTTIEDTLLLDLRPEEDPDTFTLGLDFEMELDVLDGNFGQFQEEPGFGGVQSVQASAFLEVVESRPQSSGITLTNRSFGQAGHNVVGLVTFLEESDTYNVNYQPQTTPPNVEFFFDPDDPNNIGQTNMWDVTDVRTVVSSRSNDYIAGSIEIDIWVDGPASIDFRGRAQGSAVGGAGTFAGVSSLNTSSFFVNAPEGITWTSESGLFLTAQTPPTSVSAVPLPASSLLLMAGGAILMAMRRRAGSV